MGNPGHYRSSGHHRPSKSARPRRLGIKDDPHAIPPIVHPAPELPLPSESVNVGTKANALYLSFQV